MKVPKVNRCLIVGCACFVSLLSRTQAQVSPVSSVAWLNLFRQDRADCATLMGTANTPEERGATWTLTEAATHMALYAEAVEGMSAMYGAVNDDSKQIALQTMIPRLRDIKDRFKGEVEDCSSVIGFARRPGTVSAAEHLRDHIRRFETSINFIIACANKPKTPVNFDDLIPRRKL